MPLPPKPKPRRKFPWTRVSSEPAPDYEACRQHIRTIVLEAMTQHAENSASADAS